MHFLLMALFMATSSMFASETEVFSNITLINNGIGNAILVETEKGNILIDTGLDISILTNRIPTVEYLIDTHRHRDHVMGNEFYGRKGATIIAHKNTTEYLKGIKKAKKISLMKRLGSSNLFFKKLFLLSRKDNRLLV